MAPIDCSPAMTEVPSPVVQDVDIIEAATVPAPIPAALKPRMEAAAGTTTGAAAVDTTTAPVAMAALRFLKSAIQIKFDKL